MKLGRIKESLILSSDFNVFKALKSVCVRSGSQSLSILIGDGVLIKHDVEGKKVVEKYNWSILLQNQRCLS